MTFSTLATCLLAFGSTGYARYILQDDFVGGGNFFSRFDFFTGNDPTGGFVQFQDQNSGRDLISQSNTNVQMRVDSSNNAPNGRRSIRIASKNRYSPPSLFIMDADHMPTGCGTWPAYWLLGPNPWPVHGEVDIIEGVNEGTVNAMSLHTTQGCSIRNFGAFTGTQTTTNCWNQAPGQIDNAGCGISASGGNTFGAPFNAGRGGVYATEWNNDAITIWFFPRGSIPGDITNNNPTPANWPKSQAQFYGSTDCNLAAHFDNLQIIFDTTLCGQWAGNVFGSDSCASKGSCTNFVANNPAAFREAYWSINALKVFRNY